MAFLGKTTCTADGMLFPTSVFSNGLLFSFYQFANVGQSEPLSNSHLTTIDQMYNSRTLQQYTNPLFVVRYVNSPGHETVKQVSYYFECTCYK